MMNLRHISILVLTLLCLVNTSCTKKEETLGATQMWSKAVAYDPNIELIFLSDTENESSRRILCENYLSEGCVEGSGKRIKIRLVELIVLQYESAKQACLSALSIGQWYAYNWLFDDVSDEPVLENYVLNAFKAKKPKSKLDCKI